MSHYKPYLKYKDSGVEWIGEVPEHWTVMQLKRAASICNGQDYKDIEDADGAYPVIGSGGEFARASSFIFNGESVLLGRKGTIDKPLYINGPFWTVDTMFYTRIATDTFPKFVYYSALTIPFSFYSTNTALPSMTGEALSSHLIAAPKLTEQRDIANSLDRETTRIDAIIAKKTRFIELLKEKRSALITHAVTKGINPNVKMKDSGVDWIGEVPEHWDVKRFKFAFSSSKNGIWGDDPNGVDDIFCVRVADFDRATLSVCDEIPTLRAVPPKDREGRLLRRGNLLLEKSGGGENQPVGQVVIYSLDKDAICSNFIARMELVQDALPAFWNYSFAAAYDVRLNLRSVKQTSGIQNLDQEQYLSEYAAFPPFDEQAAIATALDRETARIDLLTQKTKHSIDLLKERRSALITAAVTGQIDLREQA